MHKKSAIVIFSVSPQFDRSFGNDFFSALPWNEIDFLFTAMLEDVIEQCCQLKSVDVFLYHNEKELSQDFISRFRGRIVVKDLQGELHSDQVKQIIEYLFLSNYQHVVIILENHPFINDKLLLKIFSQLEYDDECIVYGPTFEDRCFIIGMNSNQSHIFDSQKEGFIVPTRQLLESLYSNDVILFPTKVMYSLCDGHSLNCLKNEIEQLTNAGKLIPRRTFEALMFFEKKYKARKLK